ncbi:hypothetical protein [Azospira sp. I13]|uniref:hypothetical protein n=1 Tax=Azospira sp. I13 TaxID=1765050 RepID=UPI0010582875|nr:hypothetical protein [Azospira sp. I13]
MFMSRKRWQPGGVLPVLYGSATTYMADCRLLHIRAMPFIPLLIGCVAVVLGVVGYVAIIFCSPMPFNVMDRDNSGVVSLIEAIDSLDVGQRVVTGKESCTEYFWLKDGLPAYEVCAEKL